MKEYFVTEFVTKFSKFWFMRSFSSGNLATIGLSFTTYKNIYLFKKSYTATEKPGVYSTQNIPTGNNLEISGTF